MIPILVGAAAASVLAALVAVLIWVAVPPRHRKAVVEPLPPISDEEFLARCSPGVDPKVALKVRRMFAEYFGIEYERVHPTTNFLDDLG